MANMFDENGNYNKTEWKPGDRITAGKLNKIEESLEAINNNDIERHKEADERLDALEEQKEAVNDRFDELEDLVADNKSEVEALIYENNVKMDRLEQEMNEGIEEIHNVAETVDGKIAEVHDVAEEMEGLLDETKSFTTNAKSEIGTATTNAKSEIETATENGLTELEDLIKVFDMEEVYKKVDGSLKKVSWVHINETEAIIDDANIDNSLIIKNLLENNDYVKIEGTYYTNAITVDRTGRPPLTIEGNFTLIAKDSNNDHILKFIGQVFQYGRMNLKGNNKVINNLVLSTNTARSYFDNVNVEKANTNGVYVEYVTLPRFKRLKTHMNGEKLSTDYTRVSGDSNGMILNVSGISDDVFNINNIHFVIIDGTLYKVIEANSVDNNQQLKVYPNNENLNSGSCRIMVGTGVFNKGTKLLIDDFDASSNPVALYTDAGHGITINHSVIQASPVGFAIGKTGLGSSQFANNLFNAPWIEVDIEFPFVLSGSSGSGVAVIEPFTTTDNFDMFTLFKGYPTVTVIKNGRIFENMKNDIYNINAGTRTIETGKTMLIKSTSGTSQFEIILDNSNTKKFILNSGETTVYIENKNARNVNFTSKDSNITINGTSNLLLESVSKAKITFILDATKNNFVSFVTTY